jgi:D-alanyl-D-alanine carboxypeptidase/D-alanyl-D-alanine-endopeptidase (penicillin-binding protein 4)
MKLLEPHDPTGGGKGLRTLSNHVDMIKSADNILRCGRACRTVPWLMLWLMLVLQPCPAKSSSEAEQYINNGGYMVRDGSGLLQYRQQELFTPASTLKILTSLVALEKLGSNYRFETHFFLDQQKNLYIKGYGDPFLTSEAILEIGKKLAELGVDQLGALFLDESSFALKGETAGDENSANPYDAPNGALAVNFNALPIRIAKDAAITSGEPETPLIAMMTEAGAGLSPGRHRLNIGTLLQSGQLSPALRYTGELFIAQFQQTGIRVGKGFREKPVPKDLPPIYIHYGTKSLDEIIRACLKNSNNYIANQLFLACGAREFGLPATWEKSRRSFAVFAEETLDLGPNHISVQEGSGLSRQNRLSPSALVAILERFKPHSELLSRKNDILLKSGTMKGVYCYAGYFSQEDSLTPFAILLNQAQNNRDSILQAVHAALRLRKSPRIKQYSK